MYNTLPDSIDFEAYLKRTETKNHKMRKPSHYMSETIERMFGDAQSNHAKLPFGQADMQFRPGEVSIWAGTNGHGKSMVISQVMFGFMQQAYKCGVASFELQPEALNKRMILQAAGGIPSVEYVRDFLFWADNKIWYADVRGSASMNDILGMVRYAAQEEGVQHFCIDNLMCCVPGEEQYDAQKEFVFELCGMARELEIHVHVVHHIRKLMDEKTVPNKFDIKGSGSITDRVDNVIIVYRNKTKEANLMKGESEFTPEKWQLWKDAYDAKLIIAKQRDGGEETEVRLWYHKESMSYTDHKLHGSRPSGFSVPKTRSAGLVAKETPFLVEEQL